MILVLILLAGWVGPAAGAVRIATYNIALGEIRPGLDTVLSALCQQTWQGITQPLDILILQEQDSVESTTQAVADLLNQVTGTSQYRRSRVNGVGPGGTVAVVYNVHAVELLEETVIRPPAASDRPVIRYLFQLVGYTRDTARFYVYAAHFKATTADSSASRRAAHAAQIRADADALGPEAQVIYAGDFNIYSTSEAAWERFMADGPARAIDPAGVPDWNGSAYRRWHTQAPSLHPSDPSLVGGGMDDRFDFQLISPALADGRGLDLVEGSYRTFGNNGTHSYNGSVTSGSGASPAVLRALTTASDHCPVVADYRHPARMAVTAPDLPGAVLARGFRYTLQVANTAPCHSGTDGAAVLDYTLQTNLAGRQTAELPAEWTLTHTGSLPAVHQVRYWIDPVGFQLTGAGTVSSTSDGFTYLWRTLAGDGSLELKVSNLQSSSPGAAAGLMLRQSLDPDSPFGFIYLTRDFGLKWRKRVVPGGMAFVSNGPQDLTSAWLRLTRRGGRIDAAWSADRQNWTNWQSLPLSDLPPTVYIGMAAASYAPDTTVTARFDTEEVAGSEGGSLGGRALPAADPASHSFLLGQGETGQRTFNIEITCDDPTVENPYFSASFAYRYADYDDFTGDHLFDMADIDYLLQALGTTDPACDLNHSGRVDWADLSILFDEILDRPLGDVDLDGRVGLTDLVTLVHSFASRTTGWNNAELNGDGIVNIADLDIIARNWLRTN